MAKIRNFPMVNVRIRTFFFGSNRTQKKRIDRFFFSFQSRFQSLTHLASQQRQLVIFFFAKLKSFFLLQENFSYIKAKLLKKKVAFFLIILLALHFPCFYSYYFCSITRILFFFRHLSGSKELIFAVAGAGTQI